MRSTFKVGLLIVLVACLVTLLHGDSYEFNSKTTVSTHKSFYLAPLTGQGFNLPLVSALRHCKAGDSVTIYSASPGGSVIEMFQILNAIEDSKCKTVTISDGASISAAALITMAGDEIIINKRTIFLFHLASVGDRILPATDPINQEIIRFMESHIFKYLTQEEINAMLSGQDVIISGDEMRNRLTAA